MIPPTLPKLNFETPWPYACLASDMNTSEFKFNRKNGDYVKPTLILTSQSEKSRFRALDLIILGFFLIGVAGLIYLMMRI